MNKLIKKVITQTCFENVSNYFFSINSYFTNPSSKISWKNVFTYIFFIKSTYLTLKLYINFVYFYSNIAIYNGIYKIPFSSFKSSGCKIIEFVK